VISELLGHGQSLGAVVGAVTCSTDSGGALNCTGASAGLFAGLGVLLFVYLAIAVLGIVAAVKIVTKAGYSGWWVLIAFIPIVGSIFVLIFAFSTWPVTQEVEMLKRQLGSGGYGGPGGHGGRPGSGGGTPGPGPSGPPPWGSAASWTASAGPVPTSVAPGPVIDTEHDLRHVALPTFGQYIQGVTTPDARQGAPVRTAGPSRLPDPGWFPAPGGAPGQERYWNGASWTDQYR
jgi:uncharacterized membrane protein YhaH (DUF805 family)